MSLLNRFIKEGRYDEAYLLIRLADFELLNQRDADGLTPLHCAVLQNSCVLARLLVTKKAFINIGADILGQTSMSPLHVAAQLGEGAIVRLLIDWGADLRARNGAGLTPYELAKHHHHLHLCRMLADTNAGAIQPSHLTKGGCQILPFQAQGNVARGGNAPPPSMKACQVISMNKYRNRTDGNW